MYQFNMYERLKQWLRFKFETSACWKTGHVDKVLQLRESACPKLCKNESAWNKSRQKCKLRTDRKKSWAFGITQASASVKEQLLKKDVNSDSCISTKCSGRAKKSRTNYLWQFVPKVSWMSLKWTQPSHFLSEETSSNEQRTQKHLNLWKVKIILRGNTGNETTHATEQKI